MEKLRSLLRGWFEEAAKPPEVAVETITGFSPADCHTALTAVRQARLPLMDAPASATEAERQTAGAIRTSEEQRLQRYGAELLGLRR